MKQSISSFFRMLKGKTVAFVGIGVSHRQTILQFAKKGINVLLLDKKPKEEQLSSDITLLEEYQIPYHFGEYSLSDFHIDVLFRTPGMYFNQPELEQFRRNGGIVTSEMEIFCQYCPCPLFAITGSDGKTTTSTLITELLKTTGKTVHLGGNIGKALLPLIEEITEQDYAVVELSSFQLLSMRPAPEVSVITNITPNHLDVHKTMEEYISTKKQVFVHQNAFSRTVLNNDDAISATFRNEIRGQLCTFSLTSTPKHFGAVLEDQHLYLYQNGEKILLCHQNDILLPGIHNIANYLAAASATAGYVEPKQIKQIATTFGGVEHRIELVYHHAGISWYNDSIASSPTRTIAALKAIQTPIVLIAGGYDKQISYEPLAPHILQNVRSLILMGDTANKIEQVVMQEAIKQNLSLPVILHVDNMQEAIMEAKRVAQKGDSVLLSPASASFGLYKNFEYRGADFKQLVATLVAMKEE